MINFKKGPALSLHQVNYVAAPGNAVTGIEAGHVVRIEADGKVYKGAATGAPTGQWNPDAIFGFAINNQSAGDVIESGKIGVYALDGASVIETDKFTGSASSYVPGKYVGANTDGTIMIINAAGGIDDTDTTNTLSTIDTPKIIGQVVEASRTLPGKVTSTVNGVQYQTDATVVCIKLAI